MGERFVGWRKVWVPLVFYTSLPKTCVMSMSGQRYDDIRGGAGNAKQDIALTFFLVTQAWPINLVDHLPAGELAYTGAACAIATRALYLQVAQTTQLGRLQQRQRSWRIKTHSGRLNANFKNLATHFCCVQS